jgi:hypothetical protein
VIGDHVNYLKTTPQISDILHSNNASPALAAGAPSSSDLLSPNPVLSATASDQLPNNYLLLRSLLPIHAKLFEKHRLQEMKAFFRLLLTKEIAYHAKALESYSSLLECLSEIDLQETTSSLALSSSPTITAGAFSAFSPNDRQMT